MPVAPNEDIVRAILTEKWDGQRASPSLFKGENVSVSRLALSATRRSLGYFSNAIGKSARTSARANR